MSDIFISYKREEQAQARKLAAILEKEGWSVWWDPKLRAGQNFNKVIGDALKQTKCVIVIWSRLSVQSDYVNAEASYAYSQKKLVPLAIENVDLHFPFSEIHTPQLIGWDGSDETPEFRKFLEDITVILGPSPNALKAQVEAKRLAEEEERRKIAEEQLRRDEEAKRREGQKPQSNSTATDASSHQEKPQRHTEVTSLISGITIFATFAVIIAIFFAGQTAWQRSSENSPTPSAVQTALGETGIKLPEMVTIHPDPQGFMMGSMGDDTEALPWEQPQHKVVIAKPFAIGKYEVTFDEYDTFADATGGKLPDDKGWGRGQRPVINVSWEDAVSYADWLSQQTGKRYRLPSEAEWEYAARSGGKKEKWAGTSVESQVGDYAWYASNSGKKPHPVGEKKPNGLGLYDMSGNVWEWVADCWYKNYEGAPEDGSARTSVDCRRHVIRGGSWSADPRLVRSANLNWYFPGDRGGNVGFRLAQDL